MASTAQNNQLMSIRVTYALSLYRESLAELGARAAYDRACELAALTRPERADFRRAVYSQDKDTPQ